MAEPDDAAPIPIPPLPPRIDESPDYDTCLGMIPDDPSGARDFAESWAARGGGIGAAHCLALSAIALGNPDQGAAALDRLAQGQAPEAIRASLAGQAAQAWMMADRPADAFASATLALSLVGDDPDLLVARANAALALSRPADAVDDLGRALALDPKREDALVLRAAAYRSLGRFKEAQADIDDAIAEAPDDPAALLERGILRQRRGDLDGARDDWQRAMDLSPDSGTADAAEQNIALLDAGPDDR